MFLKIDIAQQREAAAFVLSIRCPACRVQGTFDRVLPHDVLIHGRATDDQQREYLAGHRKCPNPQCRCHVFFMTLGSQLLVTYPAERIDFDSTNIPPAVLTALEEAITCHASSCFTAAAIMIRKTLEELCRDRKAKGPNLKDRIKELGSKVVLPEELLTALDDVRLLGNDAAHIESQAYEQVGRIEVEVGIEVAKEVLKAVYQ